MKAKLVLAGTAALAAGILWWSDAPDRGAVHETAASTTRKGPGPRAAGFALADEPDGADARVAVPPTEEAASEVADAAWRAAALPTLPHALELGGVARRPDGVPVESARIFLAPRGHVINAVAKTDEHGRFRVRWRSSTPVQTVAFGFVADDLSLGEVRELEVTAGEPCELLVEVPSNERFAALLRAEFDAGGVTSISMGSFTMSAAPSGRSDPAHAPMAIVDSQGFTRFVGIEPDGACPSGRRSSLSVDQGSYQGVTSQVDAMSVDVSSLTRTIGERSGHAGFRASEASLDPSRLFALEGKVVDARGKTVDGARVLLLSSDGRLLEETRADAEGRYALEHELSSDACIVRAFAPSLGRAERHVEHPGGRRVRFDAQLDPGLEIRGRIVDADGEPKKGCAIEAVGHGADRNTTARTKSDDQGFFALTNCDPAEATLFVRASGDFGRVPDLVVEGLWPRGYRPEPSEDTFEELRVDAKEHGSIAFTIVSASGTPEPTAVARLWHEESGRGAWFPPRDGDARATLDDLPEGTYRIEVGSALGGWTAVDAVWLPAGEALDLGAVTLPSPSMLTLTCDEAATTDEGAEPWSVEVWSTEAGVQSRIRELTGIDGSGELGLPSLVLPSGRSFALLRRGARSGAAALQLPPAREQALRIAFGKDAPRSGALDVRSEPPTTNGFAARLAAELERAGGERANCADCHASIP